MPSYCVVANCEFKYAQSSSVSFHKFPYHTTHLLQQWIAFADRGPFWQPSRWSSICSRHFLTTDYRDHLFRKCLKRTAVPSVRARLPFDFDNTLSYEPIMVEQPGSNAKMSNTSTVESLVEAPKDANRTPSPLLRYCRLCATSNPGTRHLDEPGIVAAMRKCCPTLVVDANSRLSRFVCSDCLVQINRFVQFVERIAAVQSDLQMHLSTTQPSYSALEMLANQASLSSASVAVAETTFGVRAAQPQKSPPASTSAAAKTVRSSVVTAATVTATSAKVMHIKQEPLMLNVKQEFAESNRSTAPAPIVPVATSLPQTELQHVKYAPCLEFEPDNDAFCEFCDVYFINNLELKKHIVNYHNSTMQLTPESGGIVSNNNNCEIMEIITLENAFINLAEETDQLPGSPQKDPLQLQPTSLEDLRSHVVSEDMIPLERVLKVEHFNDYEQRELHAMLIRREHNYCARAEPADYDASANGLVSANRLVSAEPIACIDFKQEIKTVDSKTLLHQLLPKAATITVATQLQIKEVNKVSAPRYDCPKCEHSFESLHQRIVHRYQEHNSRMATNCRLHKLSAVIQCSYCDQVMYSKVAWNNHSIVCKRWQRMSRLYHRQNPLAGKLKYHRIGSVNVRLALNSAEHFQTRKNQQLTKIADSSRRYECKTCGRIYSRHNIFKRHLQIHRPRNRSRAKHLPAASVQTTATCPIPETSCEEPPTPVPKHPTGQISDKSYVCLTCNKCFRRSENLRQHATTHTTERRHACKLCDKVFKRAAGLKQHVQGFHYKIRPHVCGVCGYAYALKGDMNRCKHSSLKFGERSEDQL